MNHPTQDEMLLLSYGELAEPHANEIESHVAACPACAQQLAQLERGRVALDVALPVRRRRRRRPVIVWASVALAAAAALAVVISKVGPSHDQSERWTPTMTWSATAGYVTGGKAMADIDVQLTRLEQERYYGLPN